MNSEDIINTVSKIKQSKQEAKLTFINDIQSYNEYMLNTYKDFYDKYPNLFDKIMDDTLTDNTFFYMMNQLKLIEKNKISQHDASVKVGSLLVDKYVKPVVNTNQ